VGKYCAGDYELSCCVEVHRGGFDVDFGQTSGCVSGELNEAWSHGKSKLNTKKGHDQMCFSPLSSPPRCFFIACAPSPSGLCLHAALVDNVEVYLIMTLEHVLGAQSPLQFPGIRCFFTAYAPSPSGLCLHAALLI
jgi:hypothetical protein